VAGRGENDSDRLTETHATPDVKRRVRWRLARKVDAGSLLVEKNPRGSLRVPFLRALFSRPRFVHIVRDGRDVACSLVRGCGGDEWRHLKPPSWQELQARYRGVRRTARVWLEVLEIALADLERTPHLTVRYEDLVTDPRRQAEAVLEFLALDPAPEVEQFCARIGDDAAAGYEAARQTKWSQRDHNVRVGRWRVNLSPEDREDVQELLGPMLTRLGYES
jgi:sulfotransferase family protein